MTGRGKTIVATLALAGAFAAGWTAQGWRADAALSLLEQQHAQMQAAEQANALADYQRMEKTKNEAIKAAEQRAAQNRADADRAAAAVDGMRNQLASVPARIAAATRSAVDEYAATAGELLGQCSQRYTELAAKADGHALDARVCRAAWPVINAF